MCLYVFGQTLSQIGRQGSLSREHLVSLRHFGALAACDGETKNVSYNLRTFQPITIQLGSQHCQAVQALVEMFAEGKMMLCRRGKPNGLDFRI